MPDQPRTEIPPPSPPSLSVSFLGSGSSGNAAIVSDGTTTVLVDCGFSAREVATRLQSYHLVPERISAVLVTHEHTDHVRGIEVFARRFGCPVWATAGTTQAARLFGRVEDLRRLDPGNEQRIGTLTVLPFRISHDAAEPVGFAIGDDAGSRVGIATDTGVFTDDAAEALSGCDIIGLECNHDLDMLSAGPYPWFLKQRIASSRGHLSNPDAARALARIASDRLSRVHALHLSRTNNRRDIATEALERAIAELGLGAEVRSETQGGASNRHRAGARECRDALRGASVS